MHHYQSLEENHYPACYHLFILSDSHGFEHDLDSAIDWVKLDDSWLVKAIREALIPGRLAEGMRQRLEDLLYHFEVNDPYREPFYHGIETELDELAFRYRNIIQGLWCNSITRLSYNAILTRHLPSADKKKYSDVHRALLLARRYPSLVGDLLMMASFKGLATN